MCICVRLSRARAEERELRAQAIEAERERYIVGAQGSIHGDSSPAKVYTHAAAIARRRVSDD